MLPHEIDYSLHEVPEYSGGDFEVLNCCQRQDSDINLQESMIKKRENGH